MRPVVQRVPTYLALAILTIAVTHQCTVHFRPLVDRKLERRSFYDHRLWTNAVRVSLERRGELYDTSLPDFFVPGSYALYKYPPFYAGLLRLGKEVQRIHIRFAWSYLIAALLAMAVVLWEFRPLSWLRLWIVGLAVLGWQPYHEAWNDLAMECLLLPLLALAWVFLRHHRRSIWGVLVGIAAGIKVYPIGLLAIPALRHDRRATFGALVGGLATLGVGAILIPWKHTLVFFRDILPHIGGTSLNIENVSLLAAYSRLALFASGDLLPLGEIDLQTLESEGAVWIRVFAWVAWVLTAFAGFLVLWRRHRESPRWFPMAICLLVAILPTSWNAYQALLLVPWVALLLQMPGRPKRSTPWVVAGLVATFGLLNSYDDLYWRVPALTSVCRTAIAPLLFVGLHRVGSGTAFGTNEAQSAAPSAAPTERSRFSDAKMTRDGFYQPSRTR